MKNLKHLHIRAGTFLALNSSVEAQNSISLNAELSLPQKNAKISEYIFKEKKISSDSANPTIYLIFQGHENSEKEFTPDKAMSRMLAIENQFSIYHILDYLYKEKQVRNVCSEGIFYNDSVDIVSPKLFNEKIHSTDNDFNNYFKETVYSLKQGDDLKFLNIFAATGMPASQFFPFIYEDVFLTGFEDEKNTKFFEKMDYYIEHPERYTKKIEKELDSIFNENFFLRSSDAANYCLSNVNNLYNKKLIQDKNLAIVIGADHAGHYKKFALEIRDKKRDFNLTLIYPQGIQKYEKFVDYFGEY